MNLIKFHQTIPATFSLQLIITGVAANAHRGLGRGTLRECQGKSRRSGANENVRQRGRLDGLHLLHNCPRSVVAGRDCEQSVVRLLGL